MPPTIHPVRSIFGVKPVLSQRWRVILFALESAFGICGVWLIAAIARFAHWLQPESALLYLLIVAAVALFSGFWQAVVVSLATFVLDYGVALHRFDVHPLGAFTLAIQLLVAYMTSRAARQTLSQLREAESWNGQMVDLHEFTRRILEMNLAMEPGPQLAELVHEIFAFEAVALFDADLHDVYSAGIWHDDPGEVARNVYYFGSSDDDDATGISRRVVKLGSVPVGALVVKGATTPLTMSAVASLIAITFDRYRAYANESRIESERRTEQLRSTVLDSLAHAYKTPLTAIRAASTGLSEMGKLSMAQSELVALIDEQAGLLGELTTRLLTTARLDSQEIAISAKPVGVASLIEEVVTGLKDRLSAMKVEYDLPDDDLTLPCDRGLMVMLLTQYVDNACKYSIFGTTITIRANCTRNEVIFSVHSFGPVIPIADRERIFDRYYRSASHANRAAGTGIGLSVAKRVALIHGGYVWVTSDEVEGTTFFAAIPAAERKRES